MRQGSIVGYIIEIAENVVTSGDLTAGGDPLSS